MYIPELYKNDNQEDIQNFIHQNGFGILVNQTDGKPWATHIPLLLEEKEGKQILVGHVSNENPQAESFKTTGPLNPQCVINNGPVSSNLVLMIFTLHELNEVPSNPINGESGILKVNSEGTGGIIFIQSFEIQT